MNQCNKTLEKEGEKEEKEHTEENEQEEETMRRLLHQQRWVLLETGLWQPLEVIVKMHLSVSSSLLQDSKAIIIFQLYPLGKEYNSLEHPG